MAITKVPSKKYGYTYQVDVRYKDVYGVTQRYIKSGFKTKKEAKHHESSIIDKANSGTTIYQFTDKTFEDVFHEYMEMEGINKYAPATTVYYMKTFEEYIDQEFKNIPIKSVNYAVMQKYINKLSEKKNYPTLKNVKKVFAVTMKYAYRLGYVSQNQVSSIILPNKTETLSAPKTIDDKDFQMLIEGILSPNGMKKRKRGFKSQFTFQSYAMALIIGRYTGLRISEVLALKKSDFDLNTNQMTVQRKIEHCGLKSKEIYLTDRLKTKSSKCKVEISQLLSLYLKEWFEYNPHEFVICKANGELIFPATFQDGIRRISKEIGIDFHYHMLRHTYATELMMGGVNPVIVKGLLRHSQVNTTWNVYTHPESDKQHEVLEEVYSKQEDDVKFDIGFNISL